MKKILCSILASALCFSGSLPVLAGANPVNLGGITDGTVGSGASNGEYSGMSRTKVFINVEGQKSILGELNLNVLDKLADSGKTNPAVSSLLALIVGDKSGQGQSSSIIGQNQGLLTNKLISLGLDLSDNSRPASQLVKALTLMIPFGPKATPSDTIGVAAVDGTKMYQAITAYNQIINNLTDAANKGDTKALATLTALQNDPTFRAIFETLKELREQLKDKKDK